MQPQHIDHEPSAASFASLLSALTTATEASSNSFAEDLENDVVTLNCNRALHHDARYGITESEAFPSAQMAEAASKCETAPDPQGKHNRKRKSASVTVRMSDEEFAQLQQRSAQAGLTVSAYLRSCVFEAESLRAQVKQAVSELRNPPATAPRQSGSAAPKWLRLLRR